MATTVTTPNMGLILPVPGQDPGPDWANNQYASGFIVDEHSHVAGQGVLITPAAIDINADLPFNSNNATLLNTARFIDLTASLAGASPNLGCIYVAANELYYNDFAGNVTQITKTGSVNATSSGISSGTATASFSGGVLIVDSNTNTPANIQAGSILIGNNTAGSNFVTLQPQNSLAASYSLTLPSIPLATSFLTLDTSGNMGTTLTTTLANSVAGTITTPGANAIGSVMGPAGANDIAAAATRAYSASPGAIGSIAYGATQTGTASSGAPLTFGVSLVTTGRPVVIFWRPDPTVPTATSITASGSAFPLFSVTNTTTSNTFYSCQYVNTAVTAAIPPSSVLTIDAPPAGTQNYAAEIFIPGSGTASVTGIQMVAYEL